MKVSELDPQPSSKIPFRANQYLHVPKQSGCYVLSGIDEVILYIGLSINLMNRLLQHLDTPEKVAPTPLGRAIWFHWLIYENREKLERTWLNSHEIAEGKLPFLNTHHSPMPS